MEIQICNHIIQIDNIETMFLGQFWNFLLFTRKQQQILITCC